MACVVENSSLASRHAFMKDCSPIKEKVTKKRRFVDESKCPLVEYDSLPCYQKHNEFIIKYYRSEWPLRETILSIFSIHNETLNVWTHLIGFFIFLSLTVFATMNFPTSLQKTQSETIDIHRFNKLNTSLHSSEVISTLSSNWNLPNLIADFVLPHRSYQPNETTASILWGVKEDVTNIIAPLMDRQTTRWPFFAFMSGAMFCLLMSSLCHLLSCHSHCYDYVMLRLDYTGISSLIVTSFYPLVFYSFMCDPFFRNLYMSFITLFGVATVLVSLVPIFQTPEFRPARAGLFVCMGVSGLVPILHKMILFGDRAEVVESTGYELLMGLFYALGVVVYAARIPERWLPGKFDLIGHSHQWFHVLVVAGAYTHYLAGTVYLKWRDVEGC
ncbi:hypothetical protein QJS10_CPA05g01203 [Acorus calamus]|uniref:Heptahelical transmembrane protein 4-like n=1 Tax=Acorus calamus TaxID=4465 RepID=A0AAV9EVW0_ACOCL|nr:hypothetical protein QJS10_CPA05g01203 [Acorus calamus]